MTGKPALPIYASPTRLVRFRLRTLLWLVALVAVGLAWWRSLPSQGFDGYCPVTMYEDWRWARGEPHATATYRGLRYRFANLEHRDRFLADPERYALANEGFDVVIEARGGGRVRGERRFAVQWKRRFYLFSSEATLSAFRGNPGRYEIRAPSKG